MKKIGKRWYDVNKLTKKDKIKLGLVKPEKVEKPKKVEKKEEKPKIKEAKE